MTDSFAIFQFQVEYQGGPETRFRFRLKLHNKNPQIEFNSTVTTASPAIKTRSLLRKKPHVPVCGLASEYIPNSEDLEWRHLDQRPTQPL